jgi:hypothetical protein
VPVSPAATTRAREHAAVGDALITAADNEWAAVCFFYAAYQIAIAAISDDPIFDDLDRLSASTQSSSRTTAGLHATRAARMAITAGSGASTN